MLINILFWLSKIVRKRKEGKLNKVERKNYMSLKSQKLEHPFFS